MAGSGYAVVATGGVVSSVAGWVTGLSVIVVTRVVCLVVAAIGAAFPESPTGFVGFVQYPTILPPQSLLKLRGMLKSPPQRINCESCS